MQAGPEIPPHILAKRKRKAEEAAAAAVAVATAATTSVAGPSVPQPEQDEKIQTEKRPRVIGPAPPPALLDERPDYSPDTESEESSDDEIGPALPSGSLAPEVSTTCEKAELLMTDN